jgi:hypothetical protein
VLAKRLNKPLCIAVKLFCTAATAKGLARCMAQSIGYGRAGEKNVPVDLLPQVTVHFAYKHDVFKVNQL